MAENNGTMTMVGTQLYTAPEVLKGLHYGTPADVFSFAIVMSEVVTLQPPYADMMTGENGASLPQIVEMTKEPTSIRPTVSVALFESESASSLFVTFLDPRPHLLLARSFPKSSTRDSRL